MPFMDRRSYADMYGPTTGDRIRLGDTALLIQIEKDFTVYGEEVKFGGGKVIRDGMGQSQLSCQLVPDTVITNAVIVDFWGIVKADIAIKDGHIQRIGKAGNPDMQGLGELCFHWGHPRANRALQEFRSRHMFLALRCEVVLLRFVLWQPLSEHRRDAIDQCGGLVRRHLFRLPYRGDFLQPTTSR